MRMGMASLSSQESRNRNLLRDEQWVYGEGTRVFDSTLLVPGVLTIPNGEGIPECDQRADGWFELETFLKSQVDSLAQAY